MRKLTGAGILLAALIITGCGFSQQAQPSPEPTTAPGTTVATPDLAKCRGAVRGDYEGGWEAQQDQWPPSTRKPVCSGIDRPTLRRLMDEAIDDIMNGTAGP